MIPLTTTLVALTILFIVALIAAGLYVADLMWKEWHHVTEDDGRD